MGVELEHLEEQIFLAGTVLVERRLGEADLPGNVIHGGIFKSLLTEQAQSHPGDLLPAAVKFRPHPGYLGNVEGVEELLFAVKVEVDGGRRDVGLIGNVNDLGFRIAFSQKNCRCGSFDLGFQARFPVFIIHGDGLLSI